MNTYLELTILFIVSYIANLFAAFAGGGSGLLQLPILIFLGLPFVVALSTHKITSVALGIGATMRHLRESGFDKKFALLIVICGLPGVFIGALLITTTPDHLAKIALGCVNLALGIYSITKRELGQQVSRKNTDRRGMIIGGLVIFIIGFLNGALSAGTGLLLTIWLIRWFGFDYKSAVALTIVQVGLFFNGLGALTMAMLADVKWSWLPVLLIAASLGGYTGAHYSLVKGNRWIKRIFEIITIIVGLTLIFG